jgi:D-hydroxyproline dehydrogenase subunit beta
MKNDSHIDVAVVGAGIMGLAIAYAAAQKGLKVAVFDRTSRAVGASIRNFGLIWPIGQPPGKLLERALQSQEIWKKIARKAGFWLNKNGSLHLAYQQEELDVLVEFAETAHLEGYDFRILNPDDVLSKSPAVKKKHLLCGLWSKTEMTVDPREVMKVLPKFLNKTLDVKFYYDTPITGIDMPKLYAGNKICEAERVYICSGCDFEMLYPQVFAESKMIKCKLQMMRTKSQPSKWELGPTLCGGLTLRHYGAFQHCQSLEALSKRFDKENPEFKEHGIHVMVTQNGKGELVIGDSHEYGMTFDPFDNEKINKIILEYLKGFTKVPTYKIAERWHGIYAKLPGASEFIAQPEPSVTIVNGLGGAGMTLSFGLAEELL